MVSYLLVLEDIGRFWKVLEGFGKFSNSFGEFSVDVGRCLEGFWKVLEVLVGVGRFG